MDKTLKAFIAACEAPSSPNPEIGSAAASLGRYFDKRVPRLTVVPHDEDGARFVGDCPFCGEAKAWEANFCTGAWKCSRCSGVFQDFATFAIQIINRVASETDIAGDSEHRTAAKLRGRTHDREALQQLIAACEGPACPMPFMGKVVAKFARYFDQHVEGLTVGTDAEGGACFVGDCPFCGGVGTWEAEFIAGCWSCRSCSSEEQGFDTFINRLSPGLMSDDEALKEARRFISQIFRGPGR